MEQWATVDGEDRIDHGYGLTPRTKWHMMNPADPGLPACGSRAVLNVEDATAPDDRLFPTPDERCKRCERKRG